MFMTVKPEDKRLLIGGVCLQLRAIGCVERALSRWYKCCRTWSPSYPLLLFKPKR